MTIVVTVKVTDGLVLAADSAASFFDGQGTAVKIYNNANKVFNLVKVWPIGAMVYGAGGIGNASVETLTKGLRARLSDPNDGDYGLNRAAYTVEDVAKKAKRFFFDEFYKKTYGGDPPKGYLMGYRICGYSAGAESSEIWEFMIDEGKCAEPYRVQAETDFGLRWAGENEPLDRLLLGVSSKVRELLVDKGIPPDKAEEAYLEMVQSAALSMFVPAMPIQDAIDLARFLVETSVKFARYTLRPETIGGPTEIAAITKHEGFKWVARKHYYGAELNRESGHG